MLHVVRLQLVIKKHNAINYLQFLPVRASVPKTVYFSPHKNWKLLRNNSLFQFGQIIIN